MVESKYVNVGGIDTHYLVGGDGSPVIMVHGAGAGVFDWKFTIEPLSQHHRVYAPDIVGFGHSDKPKTKYTIDYCVDFLEHFMDAVWLDSASLVAHCTGGSIALGLALRCPQRIERLVLADCSSLVRPNLVGAGYSLIPLSLLVFLHRTSRKGLRLAYKIQLCNSSLVTDAFVEEAYELRNMPGATYARASIWKNFCSLGGQRVFVPDKLPLITAPTLIICGRSDCVVPVGYAKAAHRLIKNSQVCILDGCGHMPQLEMPDRFNQLVLDFLK